MFKIFLNEKLKFEMLKYLIACQAKLFKRVEPLKILLNNICQSIVAQIEQLKARETPHGSVPDIRNLRISDSEFFEQAKVLVDGAQRNLVFCSIAMFTFTLLWKI